MINAKKLLTAIAAGGLLTSMSGIFAHDIAARTFNDHRYSRSIGNMTYWVDASASAYEGLLYKAAKNREITGHGRNPIYIQPVSSNANTHVDVKAVNAGGEKEGVLAWTDFYRNNRTRMKPGDQYGENWLYTTITINRDEIDTMNDTAKQGTLAHEFGHGFGLAHMNHKPTSLMCQIGAGRTAQRVDRDSHKAINHLYR